MPVTDLKVDFATLEASESSLHRIASEFAAADRHSGDLEHVWGSREVARAMRDFVDNWDRHRATLLESVKSVGSMCGGSAAVFRAADQQLGKLTGR